MLYHEREGKSKENASFVHIVYLLAKLCNIFDEAFFIDVSIFFVDKSLTKETDCEHSSKDDAEHCSNKRFTEWVLEYRFLCSSISKIS